MKNKKNIPTPIDGTLRKSALRVPEVIRECSGIYVFGRRIKSLVFTTDIAIIRNVNADAVLAVYPFTPQPVITQSLLSASDIPVFAGVGGGLTGGTRVSVLATNAEMQGAFGVVLNAPTDNEVARTVAEQLDIPVVMTVVNDETDIDARIDAGVSILNVSAAKDTPRIVRRIKEKYPDFPVMATGGPDNNSMLETIRAGANAITWTPPSTAELFKEVMNAYRLGLPHP